MTRRLCILAALGATLLCTAVDAKRPVALPQVVGSYLCRQQIRDAPPVRIVVLTQGKNNGHGKARITGTVSGLVGQEPGEVAVRGFLYKDHQRGTPDFYLDNRAPHYLLRVTGFLTADGASFTGLYSITQNNKNRTGAQLEGERA